MEQTIGQLRRIPLFSALSDEDIRLVAGLVRERSYRRRSTIYRQGELDPTLYIVLSGRLRVWTLDEEGQRRTLNHFGAQDYFGERSLLVGERRDVTVDVEEDAVLLSLEKGDFESLLGSYPQLRAALRLHKLDRLRRVPLFKKLSAQDTERIAASMSITHYRQGSVISRQGELDTAFFIIESGRVRLRSRDDAGREGVIGHLRDGDCFGQRSLIRGEASDSTVEALEDTSLFYLNRRDFHRLLSQYRSIKDALSAEMETREMMVSKRFPWQGEDEVLVALSHKHVYAFVKSLWLLVFPLLALGGILAIGLTTHLGGSVLYGAAALVIVGACALVAWFYVDWRNDYYAVTNKRIVHVEKTPLVQESRDEAPLENVQDLFVLTPSLTARLVGFKDLGIQTAGARGKVVFKTLGNAALVRDRILEQLERVREEDTAEGREAIRRRLELKLGRVKSGLSTSAEAEPVPPGAQSQAVHPRHTDRGFLNYLVPKMRLEEDRVVTWRKHWFRLVDRAAGPLFLLFILLQLGGAVLFSLLSPPAGFANSFWVVFLVGLATSLFLLWYRYENWRNDVYQLTDERIIDIERLPLGLREERREASLAMIQDIRYEIPGLTANLLDYGNVVIETAAREAVFTFDWVHHPRRVQEEIFARIAAFREREKQQQREAKTAELLDWFASYRDVAGEEESPGQSPEQ